MDVVNILGGTNAVITVQGCTGTPLWFAARSARYGRGGFELAKLLLERGADVNAAGNDGNGWTVVRGRRRAGTWRC
jgi:ankyrin repeat protein